MKPSRSTDSRSPPVVTGDSGKDADDDSGKNDGAMGLASPAIGGSGSARVGDNGLLSIIFVIHHGPGHGKTLDLTLLRECCADSSIPMPSAPRSLSRRGGCLFFFFNSSGLFTYKRSKP